MGVFLLVEEGGIGDWSKYEVGVLVVFVVVVIGCEENDGLEFVGDRG